MTDAERWIERARDAERDGDGFLAMAALRHAVDTSGSPAERFCTLLALARGEMLFETNGDGALRAYWEARHLARRHRLGRTGEADLGIGIALIDLGRAGEGVEAIRRARDGFRQVGDTYLRGCTETILAEMALRAGSVAIADRHLLVATDLLEVAAEARVLSAAFTLRAEVAARRGEPAAARTFLTRAAALADGIGDREVAESMRRQRLDVHRILLEAGLDGWPATRPTRPARRPTRRKSKRKS